MKRFAAASLLCWVLALGGALLLPSCAHAPDPWVVSGTTIAQAQSTYEATADAMDAAVRRGAVSVETYQRFRTFGQKWQALYPLAGQTWRTAEAVGDAAAQHDAGAILARLLEELGPFIEAVGGVVNAFTPDGGR